MGYVDELSIAKLLSRQYGVPYVDISEIEIDQSASDALSTDLCKKYNVVPFARQGKTLKVAITDPSNAYALEELRFVSGFNMEPYVTVESMMNEFLRKRQEKDEESRTDLMREIGDFDMDDLEIETVEESNVALEQLRRDIEDTPIVKLVNHIMHEAVKKEPSDIHIEPMRRSSVSGSGWTVCFRSS
ncbi:MAG: hypothetical protein LRY51_12250 [Geovibrio sp.]|nr:hypothetical protein [Geovibrio sp.]